MVSHVIVGTQSLGISGQSTLPFPPEELQSRLDACRRGMAERGLDFLVLSSPENIYYLTGFVTRGYYVFQSLIVPIAEDPVLVVRRFELPNVSRLSLVQRVAVWTDTDDPPLVLAAALKELGAENKRIGIDAGAAYFPVRAYETLRRALESTTFEDGSKLVDDLRAVKSPQEIAYIRQAADLLMSGFAAAKDAARPGQTENDIAAALYAAAITAGSEYMAGHPYIVSGPRTGLPHATWAGRTIERGDLVFVESSANVHRYSAAMFRTWSVGKASDVARRAAEASLAGLDAVLATARPGVTSGEVDAACRNAIANAGLGDAFVHRTGYSVGVGISPAWGEGQVMDLKPDDPRPLQPGMVFHIVPVLFPAEDMSVGFSGTIHITEDGVELLTEFSRELELPA